MTIHSDLPAESVDFEIERLRSLALLDEMTGLPNRRAFLQRLEEAFAQAEAGGAAFSLVLLDLDGLKDINDTFGYQAGNRAIQEFGDALVSVVRADDMVARIGGDEFAVLAVHPSLANADAIIGRLRDIARGVVRPIKDGAPPAILSAAVGQGVWRRDSRSVDDLFTRAEAELLAAKAAPPPAMELAGTFRPRGRRALGEELRSLLGMARQVTTSKEIGDLLRRVAEQAAALIGAEIAMLAMVHEDGTVRFDEVWQDDHWRSLASVRPLGRGAIGRTAASGTPEIHSSVSLNNFHDLAAAQALGLRTMLSVPLRDRQATTFGVLALGNKRGGQPFIESDIGLAQAFADLAASAIENVRSFDATEEARAYQRALMEQARDAIAVVDPNDGRLLDVNAAMEQISGYHRTDLLQLTVHDLGLNAAHVERLLDDARRPDPLPVTLSDTIRRKHGTRVPVELSASHVQTHRGPRLMVIMRDIEERLSAEAEMRRRTEELEARNTVAGLLTQSGSIEAALSGVLPVIIRTDNLDGALVQLLDATGHLQVTAAVGVPDDIERLLSARPPHVEGRLTRQYVEDRQPIAINDLAMADGDFWRQVWATGVSSVAILPLVANDRMLGALTAISRRVGSFKEQNLTRMRAFADQVAVWLDSRLSLEAARAGEQDARLIADLGESLNEGRDEGEIVQRLAEGMAVAFGGSVAVYLRDEALDRWRLGALASAVDDHPLDVWRDDRMPQALIAHGHRPLLVNLGAEDVPEDGDVSALLRSVGVQTLVVTPMVAGDEVLGAMVAANGGTQPALTSRHLALAQQIVQHAAVAVATARAYRETKETRDYLQAVMRHAGDGIVVTDTATGVVVDVNDRICELLGLRREQVIGRSPITLLARFDQTDAEERFAALRAGDLRSMPVRRELITSDGSTIPIELNVSRVNVGDRTLLVGVVRDLRGRIEAERQVRFQAHVLATMRDAVVAMDREGRIIVWNRGAEDLFGWTAAEVIGVAAREIVPDEERGRLMDLVRQLSDNATAGGEASLARKDGSRMWCHVTLSRMDDDQGSSVGLIGIVRDVTAEHEARIAQNNLLRRLAEANEAATRRTVELRAIADVAAILVAGGEPDTVFAALTDRILATGSYDLASIALYDSGRDALCLRQVRYRLPYVPEPALAQQELWIDRRQLPLVDMLMAERRPLVIRQGDLLWHLSAVTQQVSLGDQLRLIVALPLVFDGAFVGTLTLCSRDERAVTEDDVQLLLALADQVAAAVHSTVRADLISVMRQDALLRLARVCERTDLEIDRHLARIQAMTEAIGRAMGLSTAEAAEIGTASVLHDIGKITLPTALLSNDGPYTAAEREAARRHTTAGEAMLAGPPFYEVARQIARSHHERWDGTGYPDGLVGQAIPLPARIVAVADVYDALTTPRPYRPAWTAEQAAEYIVGHAGIHFDPEVVAAFKRVWRDVID